MAAWLQSEAVVIASGQTVSGTLDLKEGQQVVGLQTPAVLTGTTFTFQASRDGTTFVQLYNESTAYSVTVAANRAISLNPNVFLGWQFIRIVSGSAEGAERTIQVQTRPVR